jgi:two-component system chemotaxis response regulator CheY
VSIRILVVDDSPIIRQVVKRALGLAGLDLLPPLEAADGLAALEVLAREPIDLVFADINMPRMDGTELIKAMSLDERLKKVPIVVVTADAAMAKLVELHDLGVKAFVRKPFRPEQFRDVVNKIMGG